jgi:hypothetical protein
LQLPCVSFLWLVGLPIRAVQGDRRPRSPICSQTGCGLAGCLASDEAKAALALTGYPRYTGPNVCSRLGRNRDGRFLQADGREGVCPMGLVGAFHAFMFDRSEPSPDRVSASVYRCTECDNEVRVDSVRSLPRCLICKSDAWEPRAAHDPVVVRRLPKP